MVSGRLDRPTVHFEIPPRQGLESAQAAFINWFNTSLNDTRQDPLLRAAICHLWFVTLHPFDDGNGRITRALAKRTFWLQQGSEPLSTEQIKVLNRLLDGGENGFLQGISASQYQKVAKVSKATATRHLAYLLEKGCLEKLPGGGRNTCYQIKMMG